MSPTTPCSPRAATRPAGPSRPPVRGGTSGYSLTELILSILIIAILAALGFQFSSNKLRGRAERTGCESHLKSLYGAFSVYMLDHDGWPQMSDREFEQEDGPGEEGWWEWWFNVLKPYDITEKEWMCPTDLRERNASQKREERDKFEGSYTPTLFEAGPDTPRKWRQPWLMERGNFHGDGALMIMPDGSIEPWPFPQF